MLASALSCVLLAWVLLTLPWDWDQLPFISLTFGTVVHMPFSVGNHLFTPYPRRPYIPTPHTTPTLWQSASAAC